MGFMRAPLEPALRARLCEHLATHGSLAVAVAVGTTPDTLRSARRGDRMNGTTLAALAHYLSTEGEHAQQFAA